MNEECTLLATPRALANLPERFSIDIHDWAPAESELGCLAPKMHREMWQAMRAELVRRGYRVTEYFCNHRAVHVADCVRENKYAEKAATTIAS